MSDTLQPPVHHIPSSFFPPLFFLLFYFLFFISSLSQSPLATIQKAASQWPLSRGRRWPLIPAGHNHNHNTPHRRRHHHHPRVFLSEVRIFLPQKIIATTSIPFFFLFPIWCSHLFLFPPHSLSPFRIRSTTPRSVTAWGRTGGRARTTRQRRWITRC